MKESKVAGSDCMQRGTVDFTEGSIPGHLIRFSVPMLLGNLLQALYSTVDSFWVGRYLGPQALAAVSASGPVIHALIAFVLGLTIAKMCIRDSLKSLSKHQNPSCTQVLSACRKRRALKGKSAFSAAPEGKARLYRLCL